MLKKNTLKKNAKIVFVFISAMALIMHAAIAGIVAIDDNYFVGETFAQEEEEKQQTEIEPGIETVQDGDAAEGSSLDEEGDQPINIGDEIQKEPTTGVVEDNFNVDDAKLDRPSQLQVDEKGNTTIPNDKDNTIPLLEQENVQIAGNTSQQTIVLSPTKNTALPAANQTTPLNSTGTNMTISAGESNKGTFIVNVKVTNNSPKSDQGKILVKIDGGAESKTASAQFPAKKTITKTFQFKGDDIPVGKGFTVEVEPEKSNSVTGQGVNSPAKKPEEVKLTIGQSSTGSDKFRVIVKVTNTAATDYEGGVYVDIDNGPLQAQYDITFPAKKTIQRTFEFDSKDVPVGKGFTAEVRYDDDYDTSVNGVNSPKKGPETAVIRIR